MLPSRRVIEKIPFTRRVAGTLTALALLVGLVIFETWPARPRTWIGWAIALLGGIPLLLLGEYAGEALRRWTPADSDRRVSFKRIVILLVIVLLVGVVAFVILRVQAPGTR
jgi:hypothetical protein